MKTGGFLRHNDLQTNEQRCDLRSARARVVPASVIKNPVPWPGGARCAASFAFDMDAESLMHLYFGDTAPTRIAMSSMLRYGPDIAVPRLMDMFARYDIRQTFFVPGWCVENYPAAIETIVNHGHEVGHHGYLHEKPNTLSADDEMINLRRGIDAIVKATGRRPVGYRAPAYAFSKHSLDFLLQEGFEYDSSLFGDDVPYLLSNGEASLLELPTDLALDDWPQYVCNKDFGYMLPIQSPQHAGAVFRAEFDAAWKYGGLWNTVWHPFVSGRLARCDAIASLIEYMLAKGNVWIAPLSEIASHVKKLIASGEWSPRSERLPYYQQPLNQRGVVE